MTVKHVQANGLRFAYLEQGEGPLVLLVHGFPDTARSWDSTRRILAAAGFRAVSPWTRGYHPSEVPKAEAFDADTLGADLVALIEALGHSSAVVVAHDWGASAAYSAVGQSPGRISKLVTIAIPHPAGIKPSLGLLWKVRHFFSLKRKGAATKIRRGNFVHIDELVRRWSPDWNPPPSETADVKESFAEPGSLEAALGYYRALQLGKIPPSQRKRVTVPTTCFAGTEDIIAPSAYAQAARRFEGPYEVIEMPGGHFMHREHPEFFHRELLRVLGEPGGS